MDEFFGSVHYNQNGDLLISSSFLTFKRWIGCVGILNKDEKLNQKSESKFRLSNLKLNKSFITGVSSAKWVSNDSFLASTDLGNIEFYKLKENDDEKFDLLMSKHEHDSLVSCLETKFGSELALSGSNDARIKLWDLNENISKQTYRAHDYSITSLTFNPNDSNCFISTSQDNRALLWDTRKEKPAYNLFHNLIGFPSSSTWSVEDQNMIILGSEIGEMGIYDIRNISQRLIRKIHDRLIRQVKFNTKKLIATVSEDCTTKISQVIPSSVLNEKDIKTIYEYKHNDYVTGVDWNLRNAFELVTCSWDGFVKIHCLNIKIQNGH